MELQPLPPLNKVFFIHYQCENFNNGDKIENLCVIWNDKIDYFEGLENEAIKKYADKVVEMQKHGLIPVHWSQNTPYYGSEAINKRYKDLTGEDLNLEYKNDINLSYWMKLKYGENYSFNTVTQKPHPRLDNLAFLNNFSGGESDKDTRVFPTKRAELLSKIYFNILQNTLKIYTGDNPLTLNLDNENTPEPYKTEIGRGKNIPYKLTGGDAKKYYLSMYGDNYNGNDRVTAYHTADLRKKGLI